MRRLVLTGGALACLAVAIQAQGRAESRDHPPQASASPSPLPEWTGWTETLAPMRSALPDRDEPDAAASGAPAMLDVVDAHWMALTMWGEARNGGEQGMRAVGHVIDNRRRRAGHSGFATDTVSEAWQFSCWNPGDPNREAMLDIHRLAKDSRDHEAWQLARIIAEEIVSGRSRDPTGGALFYHADSVTPRWSRGLSPVSRIGSHLFFRTAVRVDGSSSIEHDAGQGAGSTWSSKGGSHGFDIRSSMRGLLSLTYIIDLKSLLISALAVASAWICLKAGIVADFPLTLIATAIVFPVVFSISTAYKRREKALEEYGSIKSHGRALYLAARDWLPSDREREAEVKAALGEMLHRCREMFTGPVQQMAGPEAAIYESFSRLSLIGKRLRDEGLASTECSRWNQYVSRIIASFENIKHIYQYRTPRSLRAFSDFFILLLPVLYGPYFAYQAAEFGIHLFYVMPILFTLILVGLANIQDHLENPFDQIGVDDVAIDADKFLDSLESGER